MAKIKTIKIVATGELKIKIKKIVKSKVKEKIFQFKIPQNPTKTAIPLPPFPFKKIDQLCPKIAKTPQRALIKGERFELKIPTKIPFDKSKIPAKIPIFLFTFKITFEAEAFLYPTSKTSFLRKIFGNKYEKGIDPIK